MDKIGVGLIIGAVTGSSIYIWNSDHFTKIQKTILLICILFPPAQWIIAILMYFFNKFLTIEKTNLSNSSKNKNQQNLDKKSNLSISEQKQSLESLKEKGVLNENEYQEKIGIIEQQVIIEKIHKSTEYKNLKNVYESGLLTKEQFDEKVNVFSKDFKTYYSIFGENKNPEFSWKIYQAMKVNLKIEKTNYIDSNIYGIWQFQSGEIYLYHDENTGMNILKMTWENGRKRYGKWTLKNQEINAELSKTFGHDKVTLKIQELGSHVLIYRLDGKKHTWIKEVYR